MNTTTVALLILITVGITALVYGARKRKELKNQLPQEQSLKRTLNAQLNSGNAENQVNQNAAEAPPEILQPSSTEFKIVEKSQASAEVKACLDDIQDVMGIPWAPANWRSYAVYPSVMQLFWKRLKPVVSSERFLRESIELSEYVYQDLNDWYQPNYRAEIEEPQRHRLQRELNAFTFGNPQLLLEQLILSRTLQGAIVGREGSAAQRRNSGAYRRPEIKLLDEQAVQQISQDMPQAYQDIEQTFGIPIVNSDYQALAKYPAFFLAAWEDIKLWRERPEYQILQQELVRIAEEALDRLHPEVAIGEREVRDLLDDANAFDALQERIELFTRILPDLMINDAMFLYGLSGMNAIESLDRSTASTNTAEQ